LAAACGGVGYRLDDSPPPATVAVLALSGSAPLPLRDAARQLLHARLANLGYRTPEPAWIDRVLSEHGWLRDPAGFTLDAAALPAVLAALGVDAVLAGDEVDESSFNVLLLRRHAFGAELAVRRADGSTWWS